ncbi:restriction endonuclease [Leeuwenhoekiella polynyae]|uniref:Restriction endonuclease n=1 Tax=Leeuwenhoekiella polynyae TaxID=1550906 RepID=A0A4V1KQF9_9FLAO|nr:restriction endonuclease [Leeuwenhoekiella polynyae]RXG21272.1 restriction endonuclease [Leeuwenhoekiella polynyae]
MTNYNFTTLNDKEFEELARDLLSRKLNIELQSFRTGKDKGIDLRYSTVSDENEIVVQVKHYAGSKFSNLISVLKNSEYEKIEKLKPKQYIIVTSLPLNPDEKETIKSTLSPFILSTNDIYGKESLNTLISDYKDVEEKYYKLWLSSTTILTRILKNGIKGRSEFVQSRIESKLKIFVQNETYNDAVKVLNKRNFILITGAPGIGKSTLADMLTYQLLAKDFELTYVRAIEDAEESYLEDKQQVFLFDDFLGTITLDLTSSRNLDASISNFIQRVKNDNKKRLILTCRTTILNQAKEKSEKLNNSKLDIAQHEVKIQDYSDLDKAKILYNHLYFSDLTQPHKNVIFQNQFYWKIIKHRNYNPRLIEFFTDIDRVEDNEQYDVTITNFLENPEKIWEKSYENQTSEEGKILLATLFSLRGYYVVNEQQLKDAFESRLDYEVKFNNYTKASNIFRKTTKELHDAFITRVIDAKYNSIEYRFLNPSVEDFLVYYYNLNIDIYFVVLEAASYFEQFKNKISTEQPADRKVLFVSENYTKLLSLFTRKIGDLKSYSGILELDIVICLIQLFKWSDIESLVVKYLKECSIDYLDWKNKKDLVFILKYFAEKDIVDYFPISLNHVFIKLTENIQSHYLLSEIQDLFLFEKYSEFVSKMKNSNVEEFSNYRNNIKEFWGREIDVYVKDDWDVKKADNLEDLKKVVRSRIKDAIKINKKIGIYNYIKFKTYQFDYEKQLNENLLEKEANIKQRGIKINKIQHSTNQRAEIDRLFNYEPNKINDELI